MPKLVYKEDHHYLKFIKINEYDYVGETTISDAVGQAYYPYDDFSAQAGYKDDDVQEEQQ